MMVSKFTLEMPGRYEESLSGYEDRLWTSDDRQLRQSTILPCGCTRSRLLSLPSDIYARSSKERAQLQVKDPFATLLACDIPALEQQRVGSVVERTAR